MTKDYFLKRFHEVYPRKDWEFLNLKEQFNNKFIVECKCENGHQIKISVVNLLNGRGCKYCNYDDKHIGVDEFVNLEKNKYGDRYSFDVGEYKTYSTGEITFHCKKHNINFNRTPRMHLKHVGCKLCANENTSKVVNERNALNRMQRALDFKHKAVSKYGERFIYHLDTFINQATPMLITCKEHGDSYITPEKHLCGNICKKCSHKCDCLDDFKNLINEKFGNIYDFTKSVFVNMSTKITVGYNGKFFDIEPTKLLSQDKSKPITHQKVENANDFKKKCSDVYNGFYDYSKITNDNYHGTKHNVEVICPIHGSFFVNAEYHLAGYSGCKKCKKRKLELEIEAFLTEKKIAFIPQYSPAFLKNGCGQKTLDFYLPDYNAVIECHGVQHFKPVKYFGGGDAFLKRVESDKLKNELCSKNGIKVFYYKGRRNVATKTILSNVFLSIYDNNNLFTDKETLLKHIL